MVIIHRIWHFTFLQTTTVSYKLALRYPNGLGASWVKWHCTIWLPTGSISLTIYQWLNRIQRFDSFYRLQWANEIMIHYQFPTLQQFNINISHPYAASCTAPNIPERLFVSTWLIKVLEDDFATVSFVGMTEHESIHKSSDMAPLG